MRGRSVVFMARDAGAAVALAPVARQLVRVGDRAAIVGHAKAATAFELGRLPVLAFPNRPSREQILALLVRERADALVTGTSMKPAEDAAWWEAARGLGIPSLAVLDHWSNLSQRFTELEPFDCLPDLVAVMDEATVEALVVAGCRRERIRVTGQPYFDNLAHSSIEPRRIQARRDLGVDEERVVAVFASEPQARFYGASPAADGWLGYTEHDSLDAVMTAAAAVVPDALLIVKLHPLEDDDAFAELADDGTVRRPETRILRAYPTSDLIAAADVVLGMTSIFLLESATLGVPTISVRPSGAGDPFMGADIDRIPSVTNAASVPNALREALENGRREPGEGLRFATDSVRRVIDLVGEQVGRTARWVAPR